MHIRDRSVWRATLGTLLLISVMLVAPALAQAPKINPPDTGPKRGDTGGPLEFVVNKSVKKVWSDQDLRRLATAQPGKRWTNRDKEEILTISLWTFLKENGVAREEAKAVELHSRSKTLATFEGKELDKMDPLVLRTGDTENRPWRVSSMGQGERNPFGRAVVRRIVVTTEPAK